MEFFMNVAVVDDSKEDAQCLIEYLKKFETEHESSIRVTPFYSSFDFLEEYRGEYDVIFLDIEMPGSDGLEVAREIRQKDESVGIIFVTSMAQYAINGYEVNAIDFMVKPVGYYNFSVKLEKAFGFFSARKKNDILLSNKEGIRRISISEILCVQKDRDNLVFYTKQDTFCERGSIKVLKEKLKDFPFSDCNSGCLVNLNHVKRIGKDTITLTGNLELPLSRRLKKQFSQEYISYVGGTF